VGRSGTLACALLLVGSAPEPGPAEAQGGAGVEERDRTVSDLALADHPAGPWDLVVHHLSGTVTYQPASDDSIRITIVRIGTGPDRLAAASHRETIRLDATRGERLWTVSTLAWGFPDFERALDYVRRGELPARAHLFIRAPARVRARLHSRLGTITLVGSRGFVEATTHDGQIDVNGHRGELRLATGSGAVWLGGPIDAKARVRTQDGHVHARSFQGDLDVRTRTGRIVADFRHLASGDQHLWSHAGSVDVTLPATSNVVVDVHAPLDSVSVGLPLARRQAAGRRLRGVLNEPWSWLDVRSKVGPVRLSGT
jgi:hypothetical protein